MEFKGIDLTHPRWVMARGQAMPLPPAADLRPELILDEDRAFWPRIGESLELDNLGAQLPGDTEERVRKVLASEQKSIDKNVFASGNHKDLWVAFALPYQTPRLVRKHLHCLYNARSIAERHPDKQRSAVEAPVALALQCVANEQVRVQVDSPVSLLLLTGAPPTLELTAATLVGAGVGQELLVIEIKSCVAVDPSDVEGSLRHLGSYPQGTTLFHAGVADLAATVAGELNRSRGPCDVTDMGLNAVAIGAVRFGGLLNGRLWLGNAINKNAINKLEIKRALPVAIGVLGTNSAGEWFWRRVIARGVTLPKEGTPAGLSLLANGTEKIGLAECPHPDFARKWWLSRQDWTQAGLRWHDVLSIDKPLERWDLRVRMSALNLGHWKSGLPCPALHVASQADGAAPPGGNGAPGPRTD